MSPPDTNGFDAGADLIDAQTPDQPKVAAPVEQDFASQDLEEANQFAGAKKALLASSVQGGMEKPLERKSKVVALADRLGLSADVVETNYDELNRRIQLRDVDYNHLLQHRPEVASWLTIPENAAIAQGQIPVLSNLDQAIKELDGREHDTTGVLPYGYMFQQDGTIRGPVNLEGRDPIIYKNLDALRQKFVLEETQQNIEKESTDTVADRYRNHLFPSLSAGLYETGGSTAAAFNSVRGAVDRFFGDTENADYYRAKAQQYREGSKRIGQAAQSLNPNVSGVVGSTVGQLIGDAPLYLLGGEVAGVHDLMASMRAIQTASQVLPKIPQSAYLLDAWKTALAYSPIAARSGINEGAEHGTAYGVQDFLINSLIPGAAGSKFGLAKAIVPGMETVLPTAERAALKSAIDAGHLTVSPSAPWMGLAGRLALHTGSQGGIMATTELANAIHEYASGTNPDALKEEQLLPRLAQAGFMGAAMSGAFHLPGEIGSTVRARQIASNAAMLHSDQIGRVVELAQAIKGLQENPSRFEEMMKAGLPDEARVTHFQRDDWEGIAKDANMTGDELAAQMNVEEQWRLAQSTGQAMQVPTIEMARVAAGFEKPEAITSLLTHARKHADGINVKEALEFYQQAPKEIDQRLEAMKSDITAQAKEVTPSDPIYADFYAKQREAGEAHLAADSNARIMAAFFNIKAERWNTGAAERGAKPITAEEEYQRYALRVEKELPGQTLMEPFDNLINRLRKGDIPSEKDVRGESLLEFLRKKGVQDVGGDLASMEIDRDLKPGQKKLINPEGWGLDIAAERAYDEGFIADADPNTLLAAIDQDNSGKGVYREGQEHPVHGPVREALTALHEALTSKGIDIKASNEDIKKALAGGELPAIKTYEQNVLAAAGESLAFKDLKKQWRKANGDREVVEGSQTWRELVLQAHAIDLKNGKHYFQGGEENKQGSISFNAERHFLITLTGKADLSTVLHEGAHFFLEVNRDLALREGAPQQFRDDWSKIMEFLGVKEGEEIKEEHHEKWARAIEQYVMEGVSPSQELRPVFQRFALWLTHLYRKVKALVKLTPEVRGVMDRMLASDDAIIKAQNDLGTSTIAEHLKDAMTPKQWGAYLKDIQRSHDQASARVFRQAMAALRHENTKTYKREKAGAMASAAKIINERPESKAEDALVHGIGPDGKTLTDKPKLNRKDVEDAGFKVSDLPRGITAEDGIPARMLADTYEFSDTTDMLTKLANLPNRKQAIRDMADGILKAQHPDLTPDVMLTKAMEAVHSNSAHADVLGRESAALAIKAGRTAISQENIRQVAQQTIDGTIAIDVNPDVYLRTERESSKKATEALLNKEPNYAEALAHKQSEELSHALYRAALEAKEIIEKADDIMVDARRTKTQQMLGRAPGQTWQVTDPDGKTMSFVDEKIAADYAQMTGGTLGKGPGYRVLMEQLREFWGHKELRNDMTYGQVHDFYQMAKATLHQAREAFTIMVEGKREEVEKLVAEGVAVEKENHKGSLKNERPVGTVARIGVGMSKFDATMRNLSFVCRQMDGEKNGGWHWQHIDRPLTEAGIAELAMNVENTKWWDAHVKETIGKKNLDQMMAIPSINKSLSYGQRLQIALNRGSTKNLRRLMDGEGWTLDQITDITNTLTKEDWQYVKGVWDHIESKKEAIFSLHEELDGVPPEARDGLPIETPFGTIQGKYFPIIYDPALSAKAGEITMERERPGSPTPRAGFTQKTAERTDLRLLLDSRAITRHLSDVSHYLSHAETIANLNKLLSNRTLTDSMISRYGVQSFNVIRDTIQDAARGMKGPQTFFENCLHFLRTRSGAAIMGFNAMSGASQVFGMTQSMERVGVKSYMAAVGKILTNAESVESWSARVRGMSKMMNLRGESQYLESLEQQAAGHFTSVPGWFREHAYWLSNKAQWLVDLPTWVAAYDNAMAEFHGEHSKAVALADSAVLDTQGSGFLKDQSKIQRMNELGKLFMQFGSFFNKTYNLGRNRIAKETTLKQFGPVSVPLPNSPEAVARLAGSFLLLVSLPTVTMSAFREAVKPSANDDGSAAFWAKHLANDHLGYLLGTMVGGRELSGALNGFDYSGPAGLRTFSLVTQLIKQIGQGTADHGLERAAVLTAGSFWGMPAVQLQRIIDGIMYDNDHGSHSLFPPVFGPPPKK